MTSLPEGTVTFLFTDIEGSTRRWAEDPGMGMILAEHDEATRSAIDANSGHWVKHTGDGVLAVFGDANAAIESAATIQRAMGAAPLKIRIGLHTGRAQQRADDYFGLAVSTAARIMDAGHGGQILVSEATRSVVDSSLSGYELREVGTHRLKDLGDPLRLYQLAGEGLEEKFPPLRTLDSMEHNLPIQLTSFVGREAELAEIIDQVREQRLVTLTGVGGAGKTRLSLQAAAELVDEFADGAWLVELASVSDPDHVAMAISTALDVRHEKGSSGDVVQRITQYTRDKELLLVVDNCEHLLSAAADVIGQILSSSPETKVLASSREALGIPGERIIQVRSMELDGGEVESEASRLFIDRAMSVAPKFILNSDTRPHVDRICRLLDGIPLAIELAAARLRVLSVDQVAARLEDRFHLLTGGSRSALPRQQTLEATVDWSYRLLSESERLLFDRLSVFVGGFGLDPAEQVCSGGGLETEDILDLLTGLVDKSMVSVDHHAGGVSRYHLLETLRQFGLRRLVDRDEIANWKDRHLDYFARQVGERGVLSWWYGDYVPWFRAEQGNLTSALEWARESSHDALAPLAAALSELYYYELGEPAEALSRSEEGIEAAGDDSLRLRLRVHRLRVLQMLGHMEELVEGWESLRPRLDDVRADDAAWCLMRVAGLYAFDPELDVTSALEDARRAVEISERLTPEARFACNFSLGFALLWSNAEFEETSAALRLAVQNAKELGDSDRILLALSWLVFLNHTRDQREGTALAEPVEDEVLEVWAAAGRPMEQESIVWIALRRGMWELAEQEFQRQDGGLRGRRRVQLLMPRSVLRWMQGRYREAEIDLDEIEHYGAIRRWHHDYYSTRAEVAASLHDRSSTEIWVQRHFEMPMEPAEELTLLGTLRARVMAEVDQGDDSAAEETIEVMREISAKHSAPKIPSVQLGSEDFYLASAEAELTRLTGADPEAWHQAGELAYWNYWRLYSRVRKFEAAAARGTPITTEASELRTELEDLGAGGLVEILDGIPR